MFETYLGGLVTEETVKTGLTCSHIWCLFVQCLIVFVVPMYWIVHVIR